MLHNFLLLYPKPKVLRILKKRKYIYWKIIILQLIKLYKKKGPNVGRRDLPKVQGVDR